MERIIRLMEWKDKEIKNLIGCDVNYFDEMDIRSLKDLSPSEKSIIIERIKSNVQEFKEVWDDCSYFFNDSSICPFCILYLKNMNSEFVCEGCDYGINHGYCIREKSEYTDIRKRLTSKLGFCSISFSIGQFKIYEKCKELKLY